MKDRQGEEPRSKVRINKNTISESYFKEQVKNPGLFFCLNRADEWGEMEVFMRKVLRDYPQLKVLVYYTGGRMESKPVAAHLLVSDKSDFNFFGKEKPILKQWLEEHSFDLLLVFARKEDKRCNRLIASVRARLKAGWPTDIDESLLDITLENPGKKMSYDMFYSELKKYFKQLNIRLIQ